jgi:hypothetical protein
MDRWIEMIALKVTDAALLAGNAAADVKADFGTRMSRWIEPYEEELNTTKLELMFAYKCMGHGGAYRAADGAFLSAQLPYYFRPVFSTAMSIHHRHRNGHKLHRQMIDNLDHQVASIRTTHGGPALPVQTLRAHQRLPYWSVVGRKVAGKVAGRTVGRLSRRGAPTFAWQSAAHGAVLREYHEQGLLEWKRMRVAPLLQRQQLESLVVRSLMPGFQDDALLGRVITAELALRTTDTSLALM